MLLMCFHQQVIWSATINAIQSVHQILWCSCIILRLVCCQIYSSKWPNGIGATWSNYMLMWDIAEQSNWHWMQNMPMLIVRTLKAGQPPYHDHNIVIEWEIGLLNGCVLAQNCHVVQNCILHLSARLMQNCLRHCWVSFFQHSGLNFGWYETTRYDVTDISIFDVWNIPS